jgi:tRNA-splicing ligase RtcB
MVWIMLHSGSRGPGNRLAQHHIGKAKGVMKHLGEHLEDPELAFLVQGSDEFDAYIHDLMWAQAFAAYNRSVMLDAALAGLQELVGAPLAFTPEFKINNHHNYAALEEHGGRKLWITRKGAIRAQEGDLGVIPGSMGTGSYIVEGLGNADSYNSASHGAGRRMSRRKAKRQFSEDDIARQMLGVTWQSDSAKGLLDEIPSAYKDLEDVMALQVDLVRPLVHLRTVVNYKGVESGRW